jgi:hypothetical protein
LFSTISYLEGTSKHNDTNKIVKFVIISTVKSKCLSATFADFHKREYNASRKRANPRFRVAAIYPSVNLQPLIQIPKLDTQHTAEILGPVFRI